MKKVENKVRSSLLNSKATSWHIDISCNPNDFTWRKILKDLITHSYTNCRASIKLIYVLYRLSDYLIYFLIPIDFIEIITSFTIYKTKACKTLSLVSLILLGTINLNCWPLSHWPLVFIWEPAWILLNNNHRQKAILNVNLR